MSKADLKAMPAHLAIIMDGNGRWAAKRALPRKLGHREGGKSARRLLKSVAARGIPYLTLYSFSAENWQRPDDEVKALFALMEHYLTDELENFHKEGAKLLISGDLTPFSDQLQRAIHVAIDKTKDNQSLTVNLALNYGSQQEITRAARHIAADVKGGKLSPDQIDEACFASYLYNPVLPPPDLLIRTGGEQRLSNFLLWQLAYSEFYFTPCLWPDFDEAELDKALNAYSTRQRRFGRV